MHVNHIINISKVRDGIEIAFSFDCSLFPNDMSELKLRIKNTLLALITYTNNYEGVVA